MGQQKFIQLLILLITFSLVSKLFRVSHPPDFYFDEVYHAYTAQRYLHQEIPSYDPWAPNPPRLANEWTHPPLAKLIMAGFMAVFGETSLSWRLGSVLFGTLNILLTVLITLHLFRNRGIALLAGLLLSLEGLSFAQSRIAMNDSYFISFALMALFYYLKWKTGFQKKFLIMSGTSLGLALSTKWTTFYIFIILGLDLIFLLFKKNLSLNWKTLKLFFICFIIFPLLIYCLSYTQFFLLGGHWNFFLKIQEQMWLYHSHLKASHPYQSKPWQWILNLRPVWYASIPVEGGKISNIYNLGNGIILWGGLIAVFFTFLEKKITPEIKFILLCYFMLWMPWFFSPRIMLFYHYTPAIPFLCILLARKISLLSKAFIYLFISFVVFWFILFYPHLTGLPVSYELAKNVYFALSSWR